jgi:hypothetical protein
MKCATKWCRNEAAPGKTRCHKCHSRWYKEAHPYGYYFNLLRCNAKRRGKQFNLSIAEFRDFCVKYQYIDKKGKQATSLSIDRKDDARGYTIDNIRVLTLSENSRKENFRRSSGSSIEAPF